MRTALGALLLLANLAHASDLPVTYNVQDRPLRSGAPAGTQLTFTLYSDSACTQRVSQATIPVESVTLISRLKLATPKGAARALATDQIQATLTGVPGPTNLYLTVTGTGITPAGNACQPQAAGVIGPFASAGSSFLARDANGTLVGPASPQGSGALIFFPSPDGLFFAFVASDSSTILTSPSTYFYHTSTDCTGSPLSQANSGPSFFLSVAGVDGSTVYYTPPAGSDILVQSEDFGPTTAGSCAGAGETFIPPDRCCCRPSGCFGPFSAHVASPRSVQAGPFVAPLHMTTN